jgi:hypothetical protein
MEAAEIMVAWQAKFVDWWEEVAPNHRPQITVSGPRQLSERGCPVKSRDTAETKIKKQQVSRWRSLVMKDVTRIPAAASWQ